MRPNYQYIYSFAPLLKPAHRNQPQEHQILHHTGISTRPQTKATQNDQHVSLVSRHRLRLLNNIADLALALAPLAQTAPAPATVAAAVLAVYVVEYILTLSSPLLAKD